jgi:hypothetical protein
MITLRYAQFFVRGATPDAIHSALDAILATDGYAPFEAARIPPGYPAEAREFDRWLVADQKGGPDDAGTVTLIAEDVRRAFARSNALAAALPRATIVALVRPVDGPLRIKVYHDGTLLLKIGDDPDEELFYHPLVAEAPAVAAFLQTWGGDGGDEPAPEVFAAALGVARADRSFADARPGDWPRPLAERVFVSARSRLYREA